MDLDNPQLPYGWTKHESTKRPGSIFYHHQKTKFSAWSVEHMIDYNRKLSDNCSVKSDSSERSTRTNSTVAVDKVSQIVKKEPMEPPSPVSPRGRKRQLPDDDEDSNKSQPRTYNKRKWKKSLDDNASDTPSLARQKNKIQRPAFESQVSSDSSVASSSTDVTADKNTIWKTTRNSGATVGLKGALEEILKPAVADCKPRFQLASSAAGGHYESFPAVEDMEVDEDELITNIQVVRQKITEKEEPSAVLGELTSFTADRTSYLNVLPELKHTVYVVVDTNVFISNLNLLKTIPDQFAGVEITLTFVIPWSVLQELDALKDDKYSDKKNPTLARQAQFAVRHVYAQLSSPASVFEGQTREAFYETEFRCESNDDKILQCCLQYAQKGNCSTILFSNDKNLCNKAIIHKVKAYTKDRIVNQIAIAVNTVLGGDKGVKMRPQNKMELKCEAIKAEVSTVETVVPELESTLKPALEFILKTRMEEIYDYTWIKIVSRKPPWTLHDMLFCFQRHWVAIFFDILNRQDENNLKAINDFFFKSFGCSVSLKEVKEIIVKCTEFLCAIGKQALYRTTVNEAIQKLVTLQTKCESPDKTKNVEYVEIKTEVPVKRLWDRSGGNVPNNVTNLLLPSAYPKKTGVSPENEKHWPVIHPPVPQYCERRRNESGSSKSTTATSSHSGVCSQRASNTVPSDEEVKKLTDTLDSIWEEIESYTVHLGKCFRVEHVMGNENSGIIGLDTLEDATSFLARLFPYVDDLTTALQGILKIRPSEREKHRGVCEEFYKILTKFKVFLDMPNADDDTSLLDDNVENGLSKEVLFFYCSGSFYRSQLKEGLKLLLEYRFVLQTCVNARPSSPDVAAIGSHAWC